tara:strand:+ start:175 stop:459 length:285 start_codon:yes stop_codon:yes gene_type:complete
MNPQICKRISRQTDVVLLEWLKTLVSKEEQTKVNISNIRDFIPTSSYFYVGRTLRLNFYSPKWVRKTIKKLVKLGSVVEEINLKELERALPHRN